MKPDDFIALLAPAAQRSATQTNVPASFVIAEGALESGWGASQLCTEAKNIFGVKADPSWKGPIYSIQTREYLNGEWCMVPADWRRYGDWFGCIADHAQFFLTNARYADCFTAVSAEEFARRVAAAGYATDPQYADKIIGIMRAHNLARFDTIYTPTYTPPDAPVNF